jgi:hypothetical protein
MDIERRVGELRGFYSEVVTKRTPDGNTVVSIKGLTTDVGCIPGRTDVLLVMSTQQDTPVARYVKHPITLASGSTPNYSPILIDGETWYGFSFNLQWSTSDPMYVYVESVMTRFAKAS